MEFPQQHTTIADVRVQLAGSVTGSSLVLADWLRELGCRSVVGPAACTTEALALAVKFRPDVVLLDFHGLTASIDSLVLLFKELVPSSKVVVLTHDASDAMRRRCQTARVDAVFEKTGELDQLAALLERLSPPARETAARQAPFQEESVANAYHTPLPFGIFPENSQTGERMGRFAPGVTQSARPRTEAEFLALSAELEQRVRERTARLETATKELEAFSYSVSHDLRAPLRGIMGFSRVLLADHATQLDGEGRRVLGVICSEARRMGELIDDLLAFSRVSRQPLDASDIDMGDLARSAFQHLIEAAPAHVPALKVKSLPPASGDRSMVRQIFANLLGNSIKFSSRVSAAEIIITGSTEGGWNTYCVADNGVGFDPRSASKLFGVFQRLHSQNDFEGTGVGLALVRRIVQRHGGRAWAEGKVNVGAKFFFTLPCCK